ncbi:lytic transglycosylase domain-containing protein [Cerasicoccus arenae]|uniref:Transglycosylase SLT domain-containing protein n=1 Tax=Cerasicoccus arenae TaxID=424488 RepID=A0A8J3GEH4_9BACT|nr:lytic transglycosylase domain-containing protein [Cerasicoccus arenae]MBK1859665.1 lytic transglycosylase domain-containing protein [Cerasicoccus arenae]GHC03926.1 hypothetical protein GCM10007047_20670 [Cerasicoccus arenae]
MTNVWAQRRFELYLSIVAVGVFALFFWIGQPRKMDAYTVWQDVQAATADTGIKPEFVYAICMAESSLKPRADSGYARGLMQVSRIGWREVSDVPYAMAYHPETNLKVGVDYLQFLRHFLKQNHAFSYARLAACYRYGPYALKDVGFAVSKLEAPTNKIYQKLFAGNTAPVEIPKPPQ